MKRRQGQSLTGRLAEYVKAAKAEVSDKKKEGLLCCSLAAGTLLAAHTPALAAIRHTSGQTISLNTATAPYAILDINGDNYPDFFFYNIHSTDGPAQAYFASATGAFYPFQGIITTYTNSTFYNIKPLPTNYNIQSYLTGSAYWEHFGFLGGKFTFPGTPPPTSYYNFFPYPGEKKYMGVVFLKPATLTFHYGWAEVQVNAGIKSVKITEWAWETCPDTPIKAGATSGGDDCPMPVPTLTEWGQCVFILILAALAVRMMKKKEEAA